MKSYDVSRSLVLEVNSQVFFDDLSSEMRADAIIIVGCYCWLNLMLVQSIRILFWVLVSFDQSQIRLELILEWLSIIE